MKSLLFIALLVHAELASDGQSLSISKIRELAIGEKCPDFSFENILNYPSTTAKLSDFKGRLVILDFWATSCGGCIDNIPKLDALQKRFGIKIAILPVTSEHITTVGKFIDRNKNWRSSNLPTITEDSVLNKYFHYDLVPHEVWINGSGIIEAITGAEEVNPENIELALNPGQLNLPIKKDILEYEFKKPFLLGGLGTHYILDKNNLIYSSLFTKYISGYPNIVIGPYMDSSSVRLAFSNVTIDRMYITSIAHKLVPLVMEKNPDFYLLFPNRTIWEAKDSSLYHWPGRSETSWNKIPYSKKVFCYEIILPRKDSQRIMDYSLAEINEYFGSLYGLEGLKEKRKVKCWALICTDKRKLHQSGGGKKMIDIDSNVDSIRLRNCTLNEFLFWWLSFDMFDTPVPIVNETGFSNPIDLEIQADSKDLNSVKKALMPFGLDLVLVERTLDMIIIKDLKKQYSNVKISIENKPKNGPGKTLQRPFQ